MPDNLIVRLYQPDAVRPEAPEDALRRLSDALRGSGYEVRTAGPQHATLTDPVTRTTLELSIEETRY